MKHAYCILAHQDEFCLKELINLIDDQRNDIFLHIDKKSAPELRLNLKTIKSKLNIIPEEKSIDVRWGGLSQVKAELILFESVLEKGQYSYIHLLSGADLPLKSRDYIYNFFNSIPLGSNVVAFSKGKAIEDNVNFKTQYYHPYVEYQKFRKDGNIIHLIQDLSAKIIRKVVVEFQKSLGIKRKWNNTEIKKGSQWISITQDFAKYLVENKNYILNKFKGVLCPDEIFVQTMLYNSPFKNTIWDYNDKIPTIRKIDWTRGNPYTWKKENFEELINSDALFARKFNSETDKEIINLISAYLNK